MCRESCAYQHTQVSCGDGGVSSGIWPTASLRILRKGLYTHILPCMKAMYSAESIGPPMLLESTVLLFQAMELDELMNSGVEGPAASAFVTWPSGIVLRLPKLLKLHFCCSKAKHRQSDSPYCSSNCADSAVSHAGSPMSSERAQRFLRRSCHSGCRPGRCWCAECGRA